MQIPVLPVCHALAAKYSRTPCHVIDRSSLRVCREPLLHRWSIIASKLPGRTDNDVKNYWNTKLKKKAMAMHQHQHYNHGHSAGGGRGHAGRGTTISTLQPAPQSQCAGSYMQPSPASASSAVTTASGDGYSFGATATTYSPSHQAQAAQQLAHYNVTAATAPLAEFSPVPTPAAANSWAINMAFVDDMFLPELVGGGEFPSGDLFGGFGPLMLQDSRASSSLQELSACYFPNAQAEMWAAAADVKPPPGAGLCPSLT
uniref:Uncharacterized protein n=1 Tax=Avena sativa TaxID=4498 RepID=A0ACD5VTS7_AVESA